MNKDRFTKEELLQARERNNKSKRYKNDTVWESNQCGSFKIIGRFDSKHLYIQFLNTNAIYVKSSSCFGSGEIKDLYFPSVYNKGFLGEGKYSRVSHKAIYYRWNGMLRRVYSGNHPTYSDCSICEQWHNFQNFARDIEELMEEQGIENLDGYEIDKDIKSKDTKVYSKETVSIITQKENTKEMVDRIFTTVYVAKNLITGEEIEFTNQSEFAREYGLHNGTVISNVLNNKRHKSTGGWTFYKKGDKVPDISALRDTVYVAENVKTGEIIEFTNQTQFAREHGLDPSSISKVLRGKIKTTGGWKFRKK